MKKLTLYKLMDSFWLDTINFGWTIVYIEGVIGYKLQINIVLLSMKIDFVLANRVDPDDMPPYAAFHPGLHSLLKYALRTRITSMQRINGKLIRTLHFTSSCRHQ